MTNIPVIDFFDCDQKCAPNCVICAALFQKITILKEGAHPPQTPLSCFIDFFEVKVTKSMHQIASLVLHFFKIFPSSQGTYPPDTPSGPKVCPKSRQCCTFSNIFPSSGAPQSPPGPKVCGQIASIVLHFFKYFTPPTIKIPWRRPCLYSNC